jgi:hypothetical protein
LKDEEEIRKLAKINEIKELDKSGTKLTKLIEYERIYTKIYQKKETKGNERK